jgi:hypothetical protein
MDRGTISGGSIASPVKEQDWSLDPVGNWSGFVTTASGSTDLNQTRSHSKANGIAGITETVGPAWAGLDGRSGRCGHRPYGIASMYSGNTSGGS